MKASRRINTRRIEIADRPDGALVYVGAAIRSDPARIAHAARARGTVVTGAVTTARMVGAAGALQTHRAVVLRIAGQVEHVRGTPLFLEIIFVIGSDESDFAEDGHGSAEVVKYVAIRTL